MLLSQILVTKLAVNSDIELPKHWHHHAVRKEEEVSFQLARFQQVVHQEARVSHVRLVVVDVMIESSGRRLNEHLDVFGSEKPARLAFRMVESLG